MKSIRLFLLALAAVSALPVIPAPPAIAQQQPAPDEPASIFGEQIDVRVVNVEVVVTDREGNRVTGLAPGDFRLRVDGKELPIEYFTEVRGGQAVATELGQGRGAIQGLPSLAPGSPVGTSYLVFIDDYFSIAARRDEVLRDLMDDLSRLGPEDRMAIVAFDGRKIDMLSNWSGNERELHRAFQQAMGRQAFGFQRLAELRGYQSARRLGVVGTLDTSRSGFANRLDLEELSYIEQMGDQVQRSVLAAEGTLRGFASPPGRKVMVLLSGGWPYSPADYVLNDANRPVINRDVPRGEDMLRPLVDTANLVGYTIYTVDVPGVEATGPDTSEGSPRGPGLLNLREQEVHATLEFVARETGGKALINGLRTGALETAESDTRSYYWLGFSPQRERNDERHRIQVDVTRPGLEARSRDNYLDLSRKSEVTMMVESALLFGNPPGAAAMPMNIGKPVSSGRREMEIPLTLAIPVSSVTMVPMEGKFVTELELRFSVLDEKGNRSAVPVIPLRITSETAPKDGEYMRYDTKLKLRKIGQHLVAAVYDPLSGKISTAEADIVPPKK